MEAGGLDPYRCGFEGEGKREKKREGTLFDIGHRCLTSDIGVKLSRETACPPRDGVGLWSAVLADK